MSLNLSQADALLKDMYDGVVRDTINNNVPLFSKLEESDKPWAGRRVTWPVKTGRNTGVGSRAEAATLPSAGNQGYNQAIVSACYMYGRVQVTGQAIAAGKHAFAEALSSELQGVTSDFANDLGRQSYGYGDGRLARMAASATGTNVISAVNRFSRPGEPGARFLQAGQLIDIGTVGTPTNDVTGANISSVSISSNPATTQDTITLSSNVSATTDATSAFIFNVNAGGVGVEMNGLSSLIDVFSQSNMWGSSGFVSGVQGIGRSEPQWNSIVLDNSGTARIVDGNLMQEAFDKVHQESNEEPDLIIGHHSVVREFLDSVSSDRRYGSMNFDSGFSKLSYNGVELLRDRQCPYNTLFLFKREAIKLYTLLDTGFADNDGHILARDANTDQFIAFIRRYGNIGWDMSPKMGATIRDIRVS